MIVQFGNCLAAQMRGPRGKPHITARSGGRPRSVGLSLLCLLMSACSISQSIEATTAQPADTNGMWRATVVVESDTGHGAGVIIGTRSVLTALHVVNDGAPKIEFFAGERAKGAVSWWSESLDLAIVHVAVPHQYGAPGLFCDELGSDQRLVAIGHPLTTRWVSVEGHLDPTDISGKTHLLPLSFDLSLGNSGGPVFDEAGRIVGIAAAILVSQTVREIAAGSRSGYPNRETGTGLMLPASEFCEELGAK